MNKVLDRDSDNPRIQCERCGKWRRLITRGEQCMFYWAPEHDNFVGDTIYQNICIWCQEEVIALHNGKPVERKCSRCKIVKPASSFHKDKNRSGGLDYTCRVCAQERFKERYPRMKGTDAYKQRMREGSRKYAKDNPEKARAHALAARHVPLKESCERCDSTDNLHRHHPDYSKPLEVTTLCGHCHETEHHGVIE